MHAILLILYFIICSYGVSKLRFIRRSRIRSAPLLALFTLHFLTGCLHNLIAWYYYPEHGDIWFYFRFSAIESNRLFADFKQFWYYNSQWDIFSHNTITFVHILLNPISQDNIYINTLLFSFPVFLGNIALFRVFRSRYPNDPLAAFSVFLIPSVLFWTSCIHREGLLYMLIGFLVYHLHRLTDHGFSWKRTIYAFFCLLFIAWVRNSVALILLPAIFFWLLLEKPRARLPLALIGATATFSFIFLAPILHLPMILARMQREYLNLEGHSRLWLPALNKHWISLLQVLPAAIKNGFFEPLPGSGGQPVYWAFSIELVLIWGIVFYAAFQKLKSRDDPKRVSNGPLLTPFGLFCLLFALGGMLIIGYMIPFAGAIIRYRSIYLPFLLAPFLHNLRTKPLFNWLNERLSGLLSHRLQNI